MGIDHSREAGHAVICAVCDKPIERDDYADRCWATEGNDEYHEACCPECHPPILAADDCKGCYYDYYNGQGDDACWMLSGAQMVTRYSISVDAPMNERDNYTEVQRPSCYRPEGGTVLVNSPP